MKRAGLIFLNPSNCGPASSVLCKSVRQSRGRMRQFSCKWFTKSLSSGLTVLASFALLISLNDKPETALAADDPAAVAARSPQAEPLEIPGSFKDLPSAKDKVTAKRSGEQIEPLSSIEPRSIQVEVDASKVAGAGGATYADNEMEIFHATAYCLKGRTASGVTVRRGLIAADPRVLPIGTVVHLRAGQYTGTYTVMDTGGRIKGRRIDVYVPTYREAIQFGRRQVRIKVVGRGSTKTDRARVL